MDSLAASLKSTTALTSSRIPLLRERLRLLPGLADLPKSPDEAEGGDFELNRNYVPTRKGILMPAAVLVPIVGYPEGERVILTKRTANLSNHAGQVSFPGGRVDATDADIASAALREAEEEIGLDRQHVEILGALPTYVTGTGFAVVPVVGAIRPGFSLAPATQEVAEIFEVPFDFLMNAANHRRHSGLFNGVKREWWAMPYGEHYIWGATAGMLRHLHTLLEPAPDAKT